MFYKLHIYIVIYIIKKKKKKNLTLPIYVYILCFVLTTLVNSYNIPGNIKTYFEALSILIYTLTIIYCLYIKRTKKLTNQKNNSPDSKVLVMLKQK